MNSATLRTKRVVLPTIAAVAALGIGGVVWASTASADDVSGSERGRVSSAAVAAVGGGKVTSAETSDDPGEAYEVEVRTSDGTEVDVTLDEDLTVVAQEADDRDGANDTPDADDRALSAEERTSAERAATAAVGGGTVTDVEAGDDPGTAYDVDVTETDGTQWDVDLDADFSVVRKAVDR
jgi:uncharacterized membrane protein YkoI